MLFGLSHWFFYCQKKENTCKEVYNKPMPRMDQELYVVQLKD